MFTVDISYKHPTGVKIDGDLETIQQISQLRIEDRLKYIFDKGINIRRDASQPYPESSKNLDKAKQAREKGQRYLRAGQWIEGLKKLNLAIQCLPEESETDELGWILAYRSAAAFELEFYQSAEEDSKASLEVLPIHLTVQRFKVWQRFCLCLSIREANKELATVLKRIKTELDSSTLEKNIVVKLLEELANSLKYRLKSVKVKIDELCVEPETTQDQVIEDCLEVHVGKAGRHVKATRDIKAGELLVMEEPCVAVLHLTHLDTNCSYCFHAVVNGVPCNGCSQVIFCSKTCRNSAASFHSLECGNILLYPPLGPFVPVLRLFTSHSLEYFKSKKDLLAKHDPQAGWNDSDTLQSLYNLQIKEKGARHVVEMTVQAYYMLDCLHKMKFFGNKSKKMQMNEDEKFIGSLLYHFLLCIEENSHEIVEFSNFGQNFDGTFDSIFDGDNIVSIIGSSMNVAVSMFNNSCDVNTIKYHQGNKIVLHAKRDILAGDEVTDFYGVHYFQTDRSERIKTLGFDCLCMPCRENWGLISSLPKLQDCTSKKIKKEFAKSNRQLEEALSCCDVAAVKSVASQIIKLAGGKSKYQEIVTSEMYFNHATTILQANKSIQFEMFLKKIKK